MSSFIPCHRWLRRFVAIGAVTLTVLLTGNPVRATDLAAADQFDSISFVGSNGVAPWLGNWVETGERNGAAAGAVRVTISSYCASSPACLRIGGSGTNINNRGVSRSVNVAGASAVSLSFAYRRQGAGTPANGSVVAQASKDGTTWQTLATIPMVSTNDPAPIGASFDITALAGSNLQIRFLGTGTSARGYLFVDNVAVAFTVANASPTALDDSYTTLEDTALAIPAPGVLSNDTDPEKSVLTAVLATNPSKGNVALNADGSFTYTPLLNANGSDSFTYRANDSTGDSNVAMVRLTLTPVNDPPAFTPPAGGYAFSIRADSAVGTQVGRVTATDPDSGDTRTYAITDGNANGRFSINTSTGSILVANFAGIAPGPVVLTITATDRAGATASVPVTVSVTAAHVQLDLKVLVLATGNVSEDLGLAYIVELMNQIGVPYDIFDVSRTTLTDANLRVSPYYGRYNGIILTESQLISSHAGPEQWTYGLDATEWHVLHQYERDMQVRESVLSGFPGTVPALEIDYGMNSVVSGSDFKGIWRLPAGGTEIYEYVNTANPLPISDWALAYAPVQFYAMTANTSSTAPTVDPAAPAVTVQPLLSCDASYTGSHGETCPAEASFVSLLRYNDGRQVLLSTITNASYLMHSQVLAYEFLNFATKGVFLGSRQVYLSTHVDDLLIPNWLWNVEKKLTPTDDPADINNQLATKVVLTPAEISNIAAQQTLLRARTNGRNQALAAAFTLDFAFNGVGSDSTAVDLGYYNPDLTAAVVANRSRFRFINHTYSHEVLDALRNGDGVATGANYAYATDQITRNLTIATGLGLPNMTSSQQVLISGEHSGLSDRRWLDDGVTPPPAYAASPIPFRNPDDPSYGDPLNPASNAACNAQVLQGLRQPFECLSGANPEFLSAAWDAGVRYLAGDSSQPNQKWEQLFPVQSQRDAIVHYMLLLPRYPTSLFYNAEIPDRLVDEYNWIFWGRWWAQGINPCSVTGAICNPRTYDEILQAEADVTLRHMLSYRSWPHYFHQSNLHTYDATTTPGKSMMFDWLNRVMDRYQSVMTLPIRNVPYYQIGQEATDRINAASAAVQGTWDLTTNQVSLKANKTVNVKLTGMETGTTGACASGSFYGGQCQATLSVGTGGRTVNVNLGLTR